MKRPHVERIGKRLAPPWPRPELPHLAIAGRSNVGKSSLINRLLGGRYAGVGKSPGKTRAIEFFLVDHRWVLADLPGYGYAKVSKELRARWGRAIEAYLTETEALRGVVVLIDGRHGPTPRDRELVAFLDAHGRPWLPVLTKADKVKRGRRRPLARSLAELSPAATPLWTSATTGEGVRELMRELTTLVAAPRP